MSGLEVRIVSLNIWDLPIPLPRFDRRLRRRRLLAGLSALDADVVLLQESFLPGFRRSVARALPALHPHPGAMRGRWFLMLRMDRSGGLFTLSRWPFMATRHQPARRFRTLKVDERIGRKGCLWTLLRTPDGELLVGNVHLHAGNTPLDARVRAVQTRDLLLHGEARDRPAVLAGDFNWDRDFEHSERGPNGFALMTAAGFREAADGRSEGLCTMDPRHNPYARYLPWHRPPRRLTHVYLRGEGLTPGAMPPALCLHDPPVSDHYGLGVTVKLG